MLYTNALKWWLSSICCVFAVISTLILWFSSKQIIFRLFIRQNSTDTIITFCFYLPHYYLFHTPNRIHGQLNNLAKYYDVVPFWALFNRNAKINIDPYHSFLRLIIFEWRTQANTMKTFFFLFLLCVSAFSLFLNMTKSDIRSFLVEAVASSFRAIVNKSYISLLPLMIALHVAAFVERRHGFISATCLHLPEKCARMFTFWTSFFGRIDVCPGGCRPQNIVDWLETRKCLLWDFLSNMMHVGTRRAHEFVRVWALFCR